MIQELYAKLNSEPFLSHHGVSYNYHIVPYDVRDEAQVFADIAHVVEDIRRPTDFIDILSLNLFDEFVAYLRHRKFFASPSLFDHLLETDSSDDARMHREVTSSLSAAAHDRAFLDFVFARVKAHFGQPDDGQTRRPYVFFYGVCQMFPYLRANEFLTKYEEVNDASLYRVILFYPGTMKGGSLSLFGILDDRNTYRAQILEI